MIMIHLLARKLARVLQPYRVRIIGGACHGVVHHAWTYQDALSWSAMYPQATRYGVCITTRRGRWLAYVI